MAPLERLKILMQVQGKERVYRGVVQVRPCYVPSHAVVHALYSALSYYCLVSFHRSCAST